MPRVFGIIPLVYAVPLDRHNCGEASFTVTNVSGQPLRGRAEPIDLEAIEPAWLAIQGEAVREFPVNAAHNFIVKIAVPRGEPGGTHSFALRVGSVEKPEEDFEISPTVSFKTEYEEAEDTNKGKKPWWVWLLIGGAAFLVVAGVMALIVALRGCGT